MVRIKVWKRDDGLYDIRRTEHGPHRGYPKIQTEHQAVAEPEVQELVDELTHSPSSEKMARCYQDIHISGWPT